MATQTEAQIQAEISAAIAVFEESRKYFHVNSSGALSNYIARESTFFASTDGDFSTLSRQGLSNFRAGLNSIISRASLQSVLDPLLRNYAKVVGTITETDPLGILRRLYDRFTDNTLSVDSREITFGTPAAGSNIGDGIINRLTRDSRAQLVENVTVEAKRADCVFDQNTGADEHEEIFEFRGQDPEIDFLQVTGSGDSARIQAVSARNSLVLNPSFSDFGGTIGTLTDLTSWDVSLISAFTLDEVNFYRGFPGDSTPRALQFTVNGYVEQLFSENSIRLEQEIPYYCQIAYNRSVGSCDGTLILTLGNVQTSVTLAAQSGWQILRIPIGSSNWPRVFANGDAMKLRIQLTGRTTGTLLVDDVIFTPFTPFDGTWYCVVGGANPFIGNHHDTFTWTDTAVDAAVIQYWLWRAYGFYLPHNNVGGETWTDPSV